MRPVKIGDLRVPYKDIEVCCTLHLAPSITLSSISTASLYESIPPARDVAKVLTGSRHCGKAADCWSVGATLFTMLAGFSPSSVDYPSAVHEDKVGKGTWGRDK